MRRTLNSPKHKFQWIKGVVAFCLASYQFNIQRNQREQYCKQEIIGTGFIHSFACWLCTVYVYRLCSFVELYGEHFHRIGSDRPATGVSYSSSQLASIHTIYRLISCTVLYSIRLRYWVSIVFFIFNERNEVIVWMVDHGSIFLYINSIYGYSVVT